MRLKLLFATMALVVLAQDSMAKDWRGIVPLKSTRADVERLLGKPNELGVYQFDNERASIDYSLGECGGLYRPLEKDNCKCMLAKDTVLSVYVEYEIRPSFSALKIDRRKYTRSPIVSGPDMFSYSNRTEGLIYTVDESDDKLMEVVYLPAAKDCENLLSRNAPKHRNSWRGLVPLHSNRRGVEALLGAPGRSWETSAAYDMEYETVTVKYSKGNCDAPSTEWNVPKDTVVEFVVTPRLSFLLRHLNLDLERYQRQELFPLPEIPKPPKVVNYINHRDGIAIRAQSDGGSEEVISITYLPATKDEQLRCHRNAKTGGKKS